MKRADGAERVERTLAELGIAPLDDAELKARLDQKLAELDAGSFATPAKMCRYVIGQMHRDCVGRVSGQRVARLVHDQLNVPLEKSPVETKA